MKFKKENRMSSCRSDIEVLRSKYEQFIRTANGKEWIEFWRKEIGSNNGGDFGDFYTISIQKCCSKRGS